MLQQLAEFVRLDPGILQNSAQRADRHILAFVKNGGDLSLVRLAPQPNMAASLTLFFVTCAFQCSKQLVIFDAPQFVTHTANTSRSTTTRSTGTGNLFSTNPSMCNSMASTMLARACSKVLPNE